MCLFSRASSRASPRQDNPSVFLKLAAVMGVQEKSTCSAKGDRKTISKDCFMESFCTLEALYPFSIELLALLRLRALLQWEDLVNKPEYHTVAQVTNVSLEGCM